MAELSPSDHVSGCMSTILATHRRSEWETKDEKSGLDHGMQLLAKTVDAKADLLTRLQWPDVA